jgi:hypothetical protein
MTAKHTPGPWKVASFVCHAQTTVMTEAGEPIAETTGFGRMADDCVADASLISAAPELLAALSAIVASLAEQDDEGMIEYAEQMIDARAAIAKATGSAA